MRQKKRIIALFLVLVLATAILSPVAAAKGFSDTRGHWGEKAITRWVDLGLAAGYEDGTFRPDRMLTRGEFAALMCSLLGLAEQADNRFGDLPADMWYTPYMLACVKAGILGGTDAGAEPESPVTREQAAVILARALAIDGKAGKTSFKDTGDISWWAVHDVKAIADKGIVAGMGDGRFAPKTPLTRAQAVTMLSAAISAYSNKENATLEAKPEGITLVAAPGVTVTGEAEDVLVAPGASYREVMLQDVHVKNTLSVTAPGARVLLAGNTKTKKETITANAVGAVIQRIESVKESVYSLVDHYYLLKSKSTGNYVTVRNGRYMADSADRGSAARFFFKASGLGEYILYDQDSNYLTTDGTWVQRNTTLANSIRWKLEEKGENTFALCSYAAGKYLTAAGSGLKLNGTAGEDSSFIVERTVGSNPFPEADTNVLITDKNGNVVCPADALSRPAVGDKVTGYADTHAHLNHNLASGEAVFAKSNFSPLGIQDALSDCSDVHGVGGVHDIWGLVVDGATGHDTSGYPDFNYWPTAFSTNHQQAYYKWLERSWLAGQRVMVQQCVNNETLGQLMNALPPYKGGTTDDMEAVRKQVQYINSMQDYIDAQCGGPGEGWFRVCTNASQAREVISKGKMAVFLGIEEDTIFGCEQDYLGQYEAGQISKEACDQGLANIEKQMDEIWNLGIRSFFPIHALDNGFGGCQLYQGAVFDVMNFLQRGTIFTSESSPNNRVFYTEPLATPDEGATGSANAKGLTRTGEWLIRQMIQRKFLIEVDHLSDKSFNKLLDICWEEKYPGLIASHTRILDMNPPHYKDAWEQMDIPRMIKVMQLGGLISVMAIETTNGHQICVSDYLKFMIDLSARNKGGRGTSAFLNNERYQRYGGPYEVPTTWYNTNSDPSDDLIVGVPYATDVNGACMLPTLEESGSEYTPVNYDDGSFTALHSGVYSSKVQDVHFARQTTGNRTFDLNDNRKMAHYGLMPDLIKLWSSRSDRVNLDATFSSAEAYLRLLERVERYSDTYPSRNDADWVTVSTEYWHGAY